MGSNVCTKSSIFESEYLAFLTMITDDKKEEVRDAADLVEVVSDYVKLKRSGSGFTGLCPYHNEKTPSFHVTPNLGIFKCFGCGESGDVFKFVMDQEGVSFTEAVRQLAERYGVFIPESEEKEPSESYQLTEGIHHALKFAGHFFYRNLIENPEAEKARKYLEKRGYNREIFTKYGLGYAPAGGSDLWKAATNATIDETYLLEADLIKPSQRDDGYYDTFRGRLMFPIFSPTGKVIAFAGRVLGNEKTAKYINTAQTKVYNKSEVVYGLNFAKNEIRKNKEVILVEGYTDVITLNQHGINNVVASSGTALTAGQMRILHRYGERIVMIYDADSAGQAAMKRGIEIALSEGMEVQLLELPDGEDPDSFVKQFGKESFNEIKKKEALDFVDFLMLKADEEGRLQNPMQQSKVIAEILEAIANIGDDIQRQVYVQHLHQKSQKFRRGTDRELFEELERIRVRKKKEDKRSRDGEIARSERNDDQDIPIMDEGFGQFNQYEEQSANFEEERTPILRRRAAYEKELIRLMLEFGKDMVEYICSFANDLMFEDEELRMFYINIYERFAAGEEVSVEAYSSMAEPYPRLLGDVLLEQFFVSDRHHEKVGQLIVKDKDPYVTAKSSLKSLELNFYKKKREEFAERFKTASDEEKKKIIRAQAEVQSKIGKLELTDSDIYYPDPEDEHGNQVQEKKFVYKMRDRD